MHILPDQSDDSTSTGVHAPVRRRFLAAGAALLASPLLALPKRAVANPASVRTLSFRHTHTGEVLSLAYAAGSTYLTEARARVDWFLRDFRNGDVHPIDPQLLDQLHAVSAATGSRASFEVISGYRSPSSNDSLRRHGSGVARDSLHTHGQAIDIRLTGVALTDLRRAALGLRAGGVGHYSASNFIHLDTGRVRAW